MPSRPGSASIVLAPDVPVLTELTLPPALAVVRRLRPAPRRRKPRNATPCKHWRGCASTPVRLPGGPRWHRSPPTCTSGRSPRPWPGTHTGRPHPTLPSVPASRRLARRRL